MGTLLWERFDFAGDEIWKDLEVPERD